MTGKAFHIGVTAVIAAAIVVGIFTAGGPIQARQEMFDQRRYADLREISTALYCPNWRIISPVLPETLDLSSIRAYCGGVEIEGHVLVDDETGVPYTYTRTDGNGYSVCALFYDAEKAMRRSYLGDHDPGASFNPDTGCMTGRVR